MLKRRACSYHRPDKRRTCQIWSRICIVQRGGDIRHESEEEKKGHNNAIAGRSEPPKMSIVSVSMQQLGSLTICCKCKTVD